MSRPRHRCTPDDPAPLVTGACGSPLQGAGALAEMLKKKYAAEHKAEPGKPPKEAPKLKPKRPAEQEAELEAAKRARK